MKPFPRDHVVDRVRSYLLREHSPHFEMVMALAAAGAAGFAASVGLLRLGLTEMWLRYPLATVAGYGAFIAVVALLIRKYRCHTESELKDIEEVLPKPSSRKVDSSDLPDIGDIYSGIDGDEGCVIVAAIALVLGLGIVGIYFVVTAPTLFAELILDSLLVGGLYLRLKKSDPTSWLASAVRRTIWPALLVVFLLAVGGAVFDNYAPKAKSIGGVIEKWRSYR